jgi:hypothetical protein
VDLRASSLERCEEGAQCPALIRGEVASESAVEDAADVGLERRTECRVEDELGESSETAACIRVGDVVDSAEDLVDDRRLRDIGLDDLRPQRRIQGLELGTHPSEVVRNVRRLRQHVANAFERPVFIDRGLVTGTQALDPPLNRLDLFLEQSDAR